MRKMFSNYWLQLLSMTVVFFGTLASDWFGILMFVIYFGLWVYFKATPDEN